MSADGLVLVDGEEPVIAFEDVSLAFDEKVVLSKISFTLLPGRMKVFLGASGSGKSTILLLVLGLLRPDAGRIWVAGQRVDTMSEADLMGVRAQLGMIFQDGALFDSLTVRENVGYRLYEESDMPMADAHARVDEMLGFVRLGDFGDRMPSELSGGQKRRVAIARAMTARPRILLYDEPTTGLDPQARHLVWEKLRELGRRGATMLLTTHYMEEAAQLCDRILIVDAGRVIAQGTPRDLVREHAGREVFEVFPPFDDALRARCAPHATRVEQTPDALRFYLDGDRPAAPLFDALAGREFLHRAANLEDVFLRLTKRDLRD